MLWADVLFAMDRAWWNQYWPVVRDSKFKGELLTSSKDVIGASTVNFYQGGNTGVGCISLAVHFGAEKITLLGYDCQKGKNGEVHHHGDHPPPLGNAGSLPHWKKHFKALADKIGGIDVANATPGSALEIFPLMDLEKALAR